MPHYSYRLYLLPLLLSLLLVGCQRRAKQGGTEQTTSVHSSSTPHTPVEIRHAKGFTVEEHEGYRLVEVRDPIGESNTTYRYALVPRGSVATGIPSDCQVIEVPIQKAICMTALQLSNFIKLDQTDKVVGVSSTRFLFNEKIKAQIADHKTHRIGIEGNFDTELILSLAPDIIMVSPFKKGGYESVRSLGIPLVTFMLYKEPHPLGQAEWLKFTAMLLGIEAEANTLFERIEERYSSLRDLATQAEHKPTVLSGELHGGNWYVVGGKSNLANLFADAGATYFLHNDKETGGFYMDYESVYAQGAHADYWRVLNSYEGTFSYDAMRATDARYADFDAFKHKQIIYCSLSSQPFYEVSPVEPEVVLADLIHIFHPEILPDHTPVYYRLLQ